MGVRRSPLAASDTPARAPTRARVKLSRYGWVRDLPDKRDLLYAAPPEVAAALPAKADLRGEFPAPYDQGSLGSCTANAIAGALQFVEMKEGQTPVVMPSVAVIAPLEPPTT